MADTDFSHSSEGPLGFREFMIAYLSGLMANNAITVGQGVDALIEEMHRQGFHVVKHGPVP